jgi:2-O-methyltransferase
MLTMEKLASILNRPDPLILEVGANNGDHTDQFLRTFSDARLFAFEPDPRAIKKLKNRNFDLRFRLIEMAVGRYTGKISFFQSSGQPPGEEWPEGWDMSGSIKRPKEHMELYPWCKFETQIEVDITRLDDWASSNGIVDVDFIWADVQGAEEDLIVGAQNTLNKTKFFFTEYSNRELYEGEVGLKQITDLLPNFEIAELYENDVLLRNRNI